MQVDDLLDFDSTEDAGTTYESAKITITQFLAYLNSNINNIYNANGTLQGQRTITGSGNDLKFIGGNFISQPADAITDSLILFSNHLGVVKGGIGFENSNGSASLQLDDSLGGYLYAIDGKLGMGVPSTGARVHVRGMGSDATTTSFLVQNSGASEMFRVYDDKSVYIGQLNGSGSLNINGSWGVGSALSVRPIASTGYVMDVYSQNFDRPYIRVSRDSATTSRVELSGGGFVYYEGFNLGYLLFGMTLMFSLMFGWNWGALTQEIILREWNE